MPAGPYRVSSNGYPWRGPGIKKPKANKIDDDFAKLMGAKDIKDLKTLIEKQILGQYSQALNSITKKEILDQIEKNHQIDLPQNLIDQEISIMTQNLKQEDKEKHKSQNEKLAKSRIKLGLLLNEFGEKNNLKVSDDEVKSEIQKQIKGMPGQEKMVLEYYQKNPSASQSLKGSLYEEKIIDLIKSNISSSHVATTVLVSNSHFSTFLYTCSIIGLSKIFAKGFPGKRLLPILAGINANIFIIYLFLMG